MQETSGGGSALTRQLGILQVRKSWLGRSALQDLLAKQRAKAEGKRPGVKV